jgi:T5orf172 domain/Domain of unknown function (DUF4041)
MGRARLSGLDSDGPIPMGTEAQAEQAVASTHAAVQAAAKFLSEAEAELESFRREAATTRRQIEADIKAQAEQAVASTHAAVQAAAKARSEAEAELESFERAAVKNRIQIRAEIKELQTEHQQARENHQLTEVGFREFPTAADGSATIAEQIKKLRDQQRELIKTGKALSLHPGLEQHFREVDINSPLMKKHIYKTFSTLFLKTFNVECEMAIRQLRRDSSFEACANRIHRAFTEVCAAGRGLGVGISGEYYTLRVAECSLVFEHLAAKAIERIERAGERERQRDEQRAQEEYSFALIQFDKELEHYRLMLARMQGLGDAEAIAKYEKLIAGIEAQADEVRLRAQNIRAGYVYVISNIGSFGDGIVKIGLTRRLEPMNRVKELSNASVPFRYDVHALYFSQDAVSLETSLHHHFEERRVNKINRRREFFRTTPREVLEVLRAHDVDLVEWVQDPEATEYRLTQGRETMEEQLVSELN